jgi:hypothetical protein
MTTILSSLKDYNDMIRIYSQGTESSQQSIESYNANVGQFLSLLHIQNRARTFQEYSIIVPSLHRVEQPSTLTPQQINESTEDSIYTAEDEQGVCPISLEEYINGEEITKIIGCGHVFKKSHLMRWFERSNYCPLCRYAISSPRPIPTASEITSMINGIVNILENSNSEN